MLKSSIEKSNNLLKKNKSDEEEKTKGKRKSLRQGK